MKRRLLITGGTGFVARTVIPAFVRDSWDVRVAVRGGPAPFDVEGAAVFPIGDFTTAEWAPVLEGVEVVLHLAARAHRMNEGAESASLYVDQNVLVTERLARAAASSGTSRFVFLSSVKACAERTETGQPLTELSPCRPSDAYGISKLEAERRLRAISLETGLPVTVVRPPLVYGPGVRANFQKLVGLATSWLPLPFSGIVNRRSLIFSGNLADALMRCASHASGESHTFFVSDGRDVSTPELIELISAAAGGHPRMFRVPLPFLRGAFSLSGRKVQFDRLCGSLQVDISRIRRELAWAPPFSLEQGLKSMFAHAQGK